MTAAIDLDVCLRLNNHGITALQCDDEITAIRSLKNSLTSLQGLLGEARRSESIVQGASFPSSSCIFHTLATIPGIDDGDGTSYVYNRGISLTVPSTGVDEISLRTFERYTACIVFNIAIFYHKRWQANRKREDLNKSISMYESCVGILSCVAIHADEASTLLMVLIAATNNLSVLFECSGETEKVEEQLAFLVRCVLQPSGPGEAAQFSLASRELFSVYELSGILLNLMQPVNDKSAAAAA